MTHPYKRDYPLTVPRVTLGCPNCLQPITFTYDPGYPDTYWEPGVPPFWHQDEHTCEWSLTDAITLSLDDALFNSPEYRAYEYAESQV